MTYRVEQDKSSASPPVLSLLLRLSGGQVSQILNIIVLSKKKKSPQTHLESDLCLGFHLPEKAGCETESYDTALL